MTTVPTELQQPMLCSRLVPVSLHTDPCGWWCYLRAWWGSYLRCHPPLRLTIFRSPASRLTSHGQFCRNSCFTQVKQTYWLYLTQFLFLCKIWCQYFLYMSPTRERFFVFIPKILILQAQPQHHLPTLPPVTRVVAHQPLWPIFPPQQGSCVWCRPPLTQTRAVGPTSRLIGHGQICRNLCFTLVKQTYWRYLTQFSFLCKIWC